MFALLALNICSTVGIVSANKFALNSWPYTVALTCVQAIATKLCTAIVLPAVATRKFMPEAVMIAVSSILSISLLNFSLHAYGVVVYQVCKAMMVPCTALLEVAFLGKQHGTLVWAALALITTGSCLASELNLTSFNIPGGALLPALGTVLSSCTYILCAWVKKVHNCAPLDLVSQQMTWQIPLGLISAYATHGLTPLWHARQMSTVDALFVLMSCALACSIQWTAMFSVFKTSPLTVIVAGQLKLIGSLLINLVIHGGSMSTRAVLGFVFVSVGTGAYGFLTTGGLARSSSSKNRTD